MTKPLPALTETAQAWSKFSKTQNYGLVPVPNQPGMAALTYHDPEPVPPEIEKRREENTRQCRILSGKTIARKWQSRRTDFTVPGNLLREVAGFRRAVQGRSRGRDGHDAELRRRGRSNGNPV